MSKKLTQEKIKEIANKIYDQLVKLQSEDETSIYYGNERITTLNGVKTVEEDKAASDYCSSAPHRNIITIISEGTLSDYFYMFGDLPESIAEIWKQEGLYCEDIDPWCWSLFPAVSDLEVEYPDSEPELPEPTFIYLGCRETLCVNYPKELDTIMKLWYDLGQTVGDQGAWTVEERMTFIYKDISYIMYPVTGYQGELSWTTWVGLIEKALEGLGATSIQWYDGKLI